MFFTLLLYTVNSGQNKLFVHAFVGYVIKSIIVIEQMVFFFTITIQALRPVARTTNLASNPGVVFLH